MSNEETVVLACPYCQGELERPLAWFRRDYFTCPACGGGLAAAQFAVLVEELDAAFEASVELMLRGEPQAGCGCGGHGCHTEE
jgi:hypothetical protein